MRSYEDLPSFSIGSTAGGRVRRLDSDSPKSDQPPPPSL